MFFLNFIPFFFLVFLYLHLSCDHKHHFFCTINCFVALGVSKTLLSYKAIFLKEQKGIRKNRCKQMGFLLGLSKNLTSENQCVCGGPTLVNRTTFHGSMP
jgi:hypothetical protein